MSGSLLFFVLLLRLISNLFMSGDKSLGKENIFPLNNLMKTYKSLGNVLADYHAFIISIQVTQKRDNESSLFFMHVAPVNIAENLYLLISRKHSNLHVLAY